MTTPDDAFRTDHAGPKRTERHGADGTSPLLYPRSAGPDGLERRNRAWASPPRTKLFTEPNNTWIGLLYILAGPYGAGDRLFLGGPIKPGLPSQGYQLGLTPAELYRTSLQAVREQLWRRGFDFASAAAAEQDAFLGELEAGRLDLGGFSSAIFFATLLANTIEGYFADPAYGSNRDMVSWRMVGFPGAYAAYLGIYTQHGIRFDRQPLSMAHAHAHP